MNKEMIVVRDKLKEKLTTKRYEHTLGVMYTCAALAMKYQYDVEKAMWAGLLHDCAKNYSDDQMLSRCKKNNIEINDTEKKSPCLLHGKLGAFYAKSKYGVEDEEILEAIRFHTTGKPNMDTLGCILFIADYIEPGRKKIKGLEEVRKCAFNIGLEEAVFLKLSYVIGYLEDTSYNIDDMTYKVYKYYSEKTGKE